MLERLLIAATLVALLLIGIQVARRWYAWRNARIERRLRSVEGPAGRPRIVSFTTQTCVICKVQQEPALAALTQIRGDVIIERHDAVEERKLAGEYGVLSVPTTAVYDATGNLVTVNRGFAPADHLLRQVSGAREPSGDETALPSEQLR